jgi:MoxR-like ATPase
MEVNKIYSSIVDEISKIIVGNREIIEISIITLIAKGHILLEGPPGVGKTTLAKTIAKVIGGKFNRIQLTVDTLPGDIIGTSVYNQKTQEFEIKKGPIFANVVMADEFNLAPPKTQAAFLEAMQEQQVTIEGKTFQLPKPFLVIATQLPYGYAGTYPLVPHQLDRFAVRIELGYPKREEEISIISNIDKIELFDVNQVTNPEQIESLSEKAKQVYVSDKVKEYIIDIIQRIREDKTFFKYSPSPRATIWILKLSRVKALLEGRNFVIPDDVKFVAPYALTHRVSLLPELQVEGIKVRESINTVIESVPVPKF